MLQLQCSVITACNLYEFQFNMRCVVVVAAGSPRELTGSGFQPVASEKCKHSGFAASRHNGVLLAATPAAFLSKTNKVHE